MGDTRPPQDARVPAVEELRRRIVSRKPKTAAEGDMISECMILLECLDRVLSVHNRHGCCTGELNKIVDSA